MKTAEVVSALLFASVGAVTGAMAYRLGLGSISHPGPGFFPLGIAALLCLMSLGLLVKGFLLQKRASSTEDAQKTSWARPLLTLAVLSGYGVFFTRIGFVLSTFILMMILVWGVGRQRPLLAFIISTLTVGVAYALFVATLGLPLPKGSLFSIQGG